MKKRLITCLYLTLLSFVLSASAAHSDDWQTVMAQADADLKEGKLDSAEDNYRSAEKLLESAKASGKDELKQFGFSLVDCLVGISKVKDRKGETAESESVYEMALETLKKFCENGWKNQQYADYLPGIANLYDRHGKSDLADGAWKRMIEIRTGYPPKDDSKIANAYELYARWLRAHSRGDEATILENKVSAMKYGQ